MLPNIGLFGYAGSGKDTVAEYLVSTYQYTRVAFADPLKEMALSIDPILSEYEDEFGYVDQVRLADQVQRTGWEYTKRNYPEARKFLRSLGATMRDRDPEYWLDIARRSIRGGAIMGMPIVVTDVRHQNEYDALAAYGFTMVRIDRPGTDTSDVDPESGRLIESVVPDRVVNNALDVEYLRHKIRETLPELP